MPLDPLAKLVVLAALEVKAIQVAVVTLLIPPGSLEPSRTFSVPQIVVVAVSRAETLAKLTS